MHTRAIFFDVDDTLLHFRSEYDEILAAALRSVTGKAPQRWLETFNAVFHELLATCEPLPYRQALDALDAPVATDDLLDALRTQETRALELPPGAHDDLERLGEDHRLGVLTNGVPHWQRNKLRTHDLDHYFEAIVTAYDAGAHKPDPSVFAAAEDALPADSYVLVGDSDADEAGASKAGWTAYRYGGEGFGVILGELTWD